MKKLVLISLLAVGCAIEPKQIRETTNKDVQVAVLFEIDGVRVYRFKDAGNSHYFAVPLSGIKAETFARWTEDCGKDCSHEVIKSIPFVGKSE